MKAPMAMTFCLIALAVGGSVAYADGQSVKCPPPTYTAEEQARLTKEANTKQVPLFAVLKTIQAGINCYQDNAAGTEEEDSTVKLLPLTKAVVDLKTVTTTSQGFSVNFIVLTIGVSHTKTDTTDFAYTYQPEKPAVNLLRKPKPLALEDAIANAALAAANLASMKDIPHMKTTSFTVTLIFGVEFKGSGGVNLQVQGITLGGAASGDKNTTHKVTLTFGIPPKKSSGDSDPDSEGAAS